MARSLWEKRVQRAKELAGAHPAMGEVLMFYADVASLQAGLYTRFTNGVWGRPGSEPLDCSRLRSSFPGFLEQLATKATPQLKEAVAGVRSGGEQKWGESLAMYWQGGPDQSDPQVVFLCRAFLQPLAELSRVQAPASLKDYFRPECPYCGRRPGLAILRPEGDGAKRSLQCSFCLTEWSFRRIVCPGCGEEDNQKLPVYSAEEFDYIRVEACDTCKQYIKSVDLTKNGLAEPVVDEIAAAVLDLWAREHGYRKLELNLMGM